MSTAVIGAPESGPARHSTFQEAHDQAGWDALEQKLDALLGTREVAA